jgi:ABC-type phosphate transport system permease subunit
MHAHFLAFIAFIAFMAVFTLMAVRSWSMGKAVQISVTTSVRLWIVTLANVHITYGPSWRPDHFFVHVNGFFVFMAFTVFVAFIAAAIAVPSSKCCAGSVLT